MNKQTVTIATLGSHSALDVSRGAKDERFSTLVVCEKSREKTYNTYYKTKGEIGCVDECIVLDKFSDILSEEVQQKLKKANAIFVPNRSFEAYLKFDYKAIEETFAIPMFGNKYLLKIEERGVRPNQYDLLDAANIRYPRQYTDPKEIDRLCLVKVLEKERGFERAFFLVESYEDYQRQVAEKMKQHIFTDEQLHGAVIEEFVLGVQVNFNFFYSPVHNRLELLGTDTRRQTNIEGITKLPASYQNELFRTVGVNNHLPSETIKYEEAGHIAVTVLESLLEQAFAMGERFVKAAQDMYAPGIIGPFALQTIITPGPPKKDIITIDVSPRMPGSPGISATPYSGYLFGESISVGRRVAREIREAMEMGKLQEIIT